VDLELDERAPLCAFIGEAEVDATLRDRLLGPTKKLVRNRAVGQAIVVRCRVDYELQKGGRKPGVGLEQRLERLSELGFSACTSKSPEQCVLRAKFH
jgi:hypothetical protein